jgi:nicotinamide mononucleotide adenylyltransferase
MTIEMVGEQSDDVHQRPADVTPARMEDYTFPELRLKRKMSDPEKTPLLLVACGSFSPITYLHLRMFEMAADHIRFSTDYELIGGYLSPVSDAYRKAGLASAEHR